MDMNTIRKLGLALLAASALSVPSAQAHDKVAKICVLAPLTAPSASARLSYPSDAPLPTHHFFLVPLLSSCKLAVIPSR